MTLADLRTEFEATPRQYSPVDPVELTRRQALVLAYIAAFTAVRGYAPTLREIGKGLGIVSVAAVAQHLGYLRAKGRLTWEEGRQRTLRVLGVAVTAAETTDHE